MPASGPSARPRSSAALAGRGRVAALALALLPLACGGRPAAEGGGTTGAQAAAPAPAPVRDGDPSLRAAVDAAIAGDPGPLVTALRRPHAALREDLGAHQLALHSTVELTPEPAPPALPEPDTRFAVPRSVKDDLTLDWLPPDAAGPRLRLRQQNEHGHGREVVIVAGQVHTREPDRPWIVRPLETEVHELWLDDAYRGVGDLLELAAPRLAVSLDEGAAGADTLRLRVSLADASRPFALPPHPRARWRAGARITGIEGTLTLDPARGVWTAADLTVSYALTAEHGARLRGRAALRAKLTPDARGLEVVAPGGSLPYPERRRLSVERDTLLDGLATP